MSLSLGIDTGGTYTDAVVLDGGRRVVASAKALTTHDDLARGIAEAVQGVLARVAGPVGLVSLSTTLATNAVVEGQGRPVGLLLIGQGREALARGGLGAALGDDPVACLDGGHDGHGEERAPLDEAAAVAAIDALAPRVSAFAISSQYAVRNPAHERRVAGLVAERTGLPVSCGHQLSAALDAPRRALTALINARLVPLLADLIGAVRGHLDRHGLSAPLMVVRGDGSLVDAAIALAAPVETILSGPAASIVGARHLAGEADAVVVDIGGTTTDVGLLADGEPRRHGQGAVLAGWRTRVDAVDIHTVGLGGDSLVELGFDPPLRVGPQRVVPLCQLASAHPALGERLRAQADEGRPREHAGWFALRRRAPREGVDGLTRSQRWLWERLADGPVDLVTLFSEQTRQRALDRLREQGLVTLAGFTPTDAAHVIGTHAQWDAGAAEAGAQLLVRRAWALWGRDLGSAADLAGRVVEHVRAGVARHVLGAVLAGTGAAPAGVPAPGVGELIDVAIGTRAGDPALDAALALRWPVVAIGAPAGLLAEGIASRLRTRPIVPEHGAVANAVGAVVAGVVQRFTAKVLPLANERYRVHAGDDVADFAALEEAMGWAGEQASRLAVASAAAAGAPDAAVDVERDEVVGHAEDGQRVFFEATVTAVARGRPAPAT